MNHTLDTTITLSRKDILRKLWSNHVNATNIDATAADHACYFALLAALSAPEFQIAYLGKKLEAAFRPSTNAKKLANGYTPYLQKYNFNGVETPVRLLSWAAEEKTATRFEPNRPYGFPAVVYKFIQADEFAAAAKLLKQQML